MLPSWINLTRRIFRDYAEDRSDSTDPGIQVLLYASIDQPAEETRLVSILAKCITYAPETSAVVPRLCRLSRSPALSARPGIQVAHFRQSPWPLFRFLGIMGTFVP